MSLESTTRYDNNTEGACCSRRTNNSIHNELRLKSFKKLLSARRFSSGDCSITSRLVIYKSICPSMNLRKYGIRYSTSMKTSILHITKYVRVFLLLLTIRYSNQTPVTTVKAIEKYSSMDSGLLIDEPSSFTSKQPMRIIMDEERSESSSSATTDTSSSSCEVHGNSALHAVLDRICEICHDMYSHQHANMRVECRRDCFRTDTFKRCLYLFKPKRTKNKRSIHQVRRHLFQY